MDYLMSWYNLIFLLPLMAGVLMVFGSFLGGAGDSDSDQDFDQGDLDVDGDAEAEQDSEGGHGQAGRWYGDILSMLGFGRVQVSVILMIMFLLFGGIGFMSNVILAPILITGHLYGCISFVLALFGMLILTGRIGRLFIKYMPTMETYVVRGQDFLGSRAEVTLVISPSTMGTVIVRDKSGTVHTLYCVSDGEVLPIGTEVVVMEFDTERNEYKVSKLDWTVGSQLGMQPTNKE